MFVLLPLSQQVLNSVATGYNESSVKKVFVKGVASVLSVPTKSVKILSLVATPKTAGNMRIRILHAGHTHTFDLDFTYQVTVQETVQSEGSYTTKLAASVSSGAFTKELQKIAKVENVTALQGASSSAGKSQYCYLSLNV